MITTLRKILCLYHSLSRIKKTLVLIVTSSCLIVLFIALSVFGLGAYQAKYYSNLLMEDKIYSVEDGVKYVSSHYRVLAERMGLTNRFFVNSNDPMADAIITNAIGFNISKARSHLSSSDSFIERLAEKTFMDGIQSFGEYIDFQFGNRASIIRASENYVEMGQATIYQSHYSKGFGVLEGLCWVDTNKKRTKIGTNYGFKTYFAGSIFDRMIVSHELAHCADHRMGKKPHPDFPDLYYSLKREIYADIYAVLHSVKITGNWNTYDFLFKRFRETAPTDKLHNSHVWLQKIRETISLDRIAEMDERDILHVAFEYTSDAKFKEVLPLQTAYNMLHIRNHLARGKSKAYLSKKFSATTVEDSLSIPIKSLVGYNRELIKEYAEHLLYSGKSNDIKAIRKFKVATEELLRLFDDANIVKQVERLSVAGHSDDIFSISKAVGFELNRGIVNQYVNDEGMFNSYYDDLYEKGSKKYPGQSVVFKNDSNSNVFEDRLMQHKWNG